MSDMNAPLALARQAHVTLDDLGAEFLAWRHEESNGYMATGFDLDVAIALLRQVGATGMAVSQSPDATEVWLTFTLDDGTGVLDHHWTLRPLPVATGVVNAFMADSWVFWECEPKLEEPSEGGA